MIEEALVGVPVLVLLLCSGDLLTLLTSVQSRSLQVREGFSDPPPPYHSASY